ncbi:integrin alpha, partial [Coleofasciculus sp. F4-SAH-05]|uniref:integrin alpha n=1 Tax=Coleofasciculus sp. F4-SAH-05 TaxID=3069525 RepID=UPI0032F74C0D
VINGINSGDLSGWSVSNGGDINNDGIDDVIIGAYSANPNSNDDAGASYVVFGDDDPSNDMTLVGTLADDSLNGDTGDDLLDGGLGHDSLSGGEGADLFLLRLGDGMDTILDFKDGEDLFLLDQGLTFGQLTIAASGADTKISVDGEELATVSNVSANLITEVDFTVV